MVVNMDKQQRKNKNGIPYWVPFNEDGTIKVEDLVEFDRQIVEECREDGLSEEEIAQWLMEI